MKILEQVKESKLVPVVRGNNAAEAIAIIEGCIAGGLRIIEMTVTNPDAAEVMEKYRNDDRVLIGAGSILNVELLQIAIDAGARFIVSPNYNDAVRIRCNDNDLLYIPGCFTPTEIAEASNNGIHFVKIFPGGTVGFDYLNAVKGPMPHMSFMVTGGVDNDNYLQWLEAGASCVGLGSSLTKDVSKIKETTISLLSKL